MHKNATKCNKTQSKWCINKHGASKIIDTFETYQTSGGPQVHMPQALVEVVIRRHGGRVGGQLPTWTTDEGTTTQVLIFGLPGSGPGRSPLEEYMKPARPNMPT
jgi:hypothetical protein